MDFDIAFIPDGKNAMNARRGLYEPTQMQSNC